MDLSPGTLLSPRRGRMVGSIRFMCKGLLNLRADFVGPRKLLFQQSAFALLNPKLQLLKVFNIVPERLAHGTALHQTYIAQYLGPPRGDSGKIFESAGAIAFQIDAAHPSPC